MRIIFCDDNPLILIQLQKTVESFFRDYNLPQPEYASYSNGEALLQSEQKPDIAFLDVQMQGISGIHVGVQLKKINPHIKIIIVTSFPDYLDEAMRFQVFRYLSKPIDKNRLFRNLKDAIYQYNMETHPYPIETKDSITICSSDDIVCIESCGRKVYVHCVDQTLCSVHTMDYWVDKLDLPCFFRTHRSFIINMRYVNLISKDSITLSFNGKQFIAYLTRRKYSEFKDAYLLYLESVT